MRVTIYFGGRTWLFSQNQKLQFGGQTGPTIICPSLCGSRRFLAIRRERGATFGLRVERAR